MESEIFTSVWDAVADTPAEAANMQVRSALLIALRERVDAWDVTQAVAAARLGVTQPRLSDLLRGRIEKFSLDGLVDLAAGAGLSVRIDLTERVEVGA